MQQVPEHKGPLRLQGASGYLHGQPGGKGSHDLACRLVHTC